MRFNYLLDVIIPTLNGKNIIKTIQSLNSGTLKPRKIFCIYFYQFNQSNFKNIKNIEFIKSNKKGQVSQRYLGIKKSKADVILQIDDDVIVDRNCLLNLVKSLKVLGKDSAISPIFLDLKNKKKSLHSFSSNIFLNLYYYLICGAPFGDKKEGKITSLTVSYGINKSNKKTFKTDWLPGGCVLSFRKAILKSYKEFPFGGKAFCEDLFFSLLRKKNKIKHYVIKNSKVYTNYTPNNLKLSDFLSELKIRKYLLKFTKGNIFRFYIWVLFELINRFLIKKILNLFSFNYKVS